MMVWLSCYLHYFSTSKQLLYLFVDLSTFKSQESNVDNVKLLDLVVPYYSRGHLMLTVSSGADHLIMNDEDLIKSHRSMISTFHNF